VPPTSTTCHFAAAVFDFDDFYKENGVDALSTQGAEQI
jgi:hypothetical protein